MREDIFIVVVTDGATPSQRDAFTRFLQESPVSFWHHLSNTWVIADEHRTFTDESLRAKAKESMPGWALAVFLVDPINYAAFASETGKGWLDKHFTRKQQVALLPATTPKTTPKT